MATKDAKVVVDRIIRAAIVVVKAASIRRIVRNDEVVVHVVHRRHGGRGDAIGHGGQVRQTVQRIERTMVPTLAACVEHQVVRNLGPAAETVVEVDTGARNVVHDVASDSGLCRDGLEIEGALLLKVADLVH